MPSLNDPRCEGSIKVLCHSFEVIGASFSSSLSVTNMAGSFSKGFPRNAHHARANAIRFFSPVLEIVVMALESLPIGLIRYFPLS